ncbi:MAG TPA: N-acetylmuramic acid 6-phosphate etherase [Bacilli bacterium]|nr:N-acetylmuramic acid 6-phosphate etherase [Bacilli bacterium]HPL58943.1 N-acetylmuramic acid 6-phosphate etherase [Bacilli bacterium]
MEGIAMVDLSKLTTEKRNKNTYDIDSLDSLGIIKKINEEDKQVAYEIEKHLEEIALVIDDVVKSFLEGGRLIYIGAGTSGRLGILDAVECPPTFSVDYEQVQGLIAGGEKAFIKAVEGAEDNKELAIKDLKAINLSNKDTLIGLSASGRTPYVVSGIEYGNKIGAKTASIATSLNSEIGKIAKKKIEVVTGAEVLTGSTRLKSGTAQKMILNMISTASMIQMGKVYENLMIDVNPTNEKLVARALSIIQDITKVEKEEAALKLKQYKTVKKTIFHLLTKEESLEKIDYYLEKNHGHLRKAIASYGKKC